MECEHPHRDNRLRQGDIFAAHPQTENWENPWRRFGVILTADCDLEQEKAGPSLVYVPIVGLQTYLADVWLPTHAAGLYDEAVRQADRTLSDFNGSRMTSRHLLKLSIEEISKQLGMESEGDSSTDDTPSDSKTDDTKARDKLRRKQFERIKKLHEALAVLGSLKAPKDPSAPTNLIAMLDLLFPQHEYINNANNPGPRFRRGLICSSLSDLITR